MELIYGGQRVEFTKSENTVGLRARPGQFGPLEHRAMRAGARATREFLGGFSMIETGEAGEGMEAFLDGARRDSDVDTGTHVYYTSDDAVPFIPTGQVYVEFNEKSELEACNAILSELAVEVIDSRGEYSIVVQTTNASPNPMKVAAHLQGSGLVRVAEPDLATRGKLHAFLVPSDPLLDKQWHLRNTGMIDGSPFGLKAGADARVVDGWKEISGLGDRSVVVAVIDDGFDLGHPDLTGTDKNVAPWDFTRGSNDPSPGTPIFSERDQDWVGDWHGTACAGVAVGAANATGIVGVAPGCRLMPIRWGIDLSDRNVEAWFAYVRKQGASVVSCSWGAAAKKFVLSKRVTSAIQACASEGRGGLGCPIVFAAGNENRDINDPETNSINGFAIHPGVIAVAASNSRDERSSYSNYGEKIAVCAPSSGGGGRGILTSDVTGTFLVDGVYREAGYSPGGWTKTFGGTSSACPLVAGICALLISVKPTLTAGDIRQVLTSTARKIGPVDAYGENGHSVYFGYGCVDAAAALKVVLGN